MGRSSGEGRIVIGISRNNIVTYPVQQLSLCPWVYCHPYERFALRPLLRLVTPNQYTCGWLTDWPYDYFYEIWTSIRCKGR